MFYFQPNCDELEKIVDKAKKLQVEAKLKARGLTAEYGTPNSTSRTSMYCVTEYTSQYFVGF